MNSHLLWLCIFLTLTLAFANERITGGQSVSQLDGRPFSYQVLLSVQTREGEFLCGGGLITNSHILTAAHCVTFFNPNTNKSELAESIEVNYGIRAASEANPETTAQVDYYSIGDYSPTNLRDDIAVLQVDRAILETEYTSIVPFYRGQIVEGSKYRVAGWGRTNDNTTDQSLEDLQYVELSVLSDAQCETRYLDYNRTGQFCLSGGAKDTCPGDSGGLVVVKDPHTNVDQAVGIVSYGELGCGKYRNATGVYVKISAYFDWIAAQIANLEQLPIREPSPTRIPAVRIPAVTPTPAPSTTEVPDTTNTTPSTTVASSTTSKAPTTTRAPTTTTSSAPTTAEPTVAPSTVAPTTESPSTVLPTNVAPSSAAPTTTTKSPALPSTTAEPTTVAPSTAAPTTELPSTTLPSTSSPSSTVAPTSSTPSTSAPSTSRASSASPTTSQGPSSTVNLAGDNNAKHASSSSVPTYCTALLIITLFLTI